MMEIAFIVIVFAAFFFVLANSNTPDNPTEHRPPGWRAGRDE
jgi:hypothetical protein